MALLTRRAALLAASILTFKPIGAAGQAVSREAQTAAHEALSEVERDVGGRLGLTVLDTGSGRCVSYRDDERFPLCSTFKLIAAALVLTRVDDGIEHLERRVVFGPEIVVPGSPLTGERTGGRGMSMAEICRAAITRSDNTAGNLMLASFGGPAALTRFVRSLGDVTTHLDRNEPTLNSALAGDERDTTSPGAMLETTRRLVLGETLQPGSRQTLIEWLVANETGGARIRAGAPDNWRIGDKTGTGDRGAAGDVAILWPPGRPPLLAAIYLQGSDKPIDGLNAAIAAAAKTAIGALTQQ